MYVDTRVPAGHRVDFDAPTVDKEEVSAQENLFGDRILNLFKLMELANSHI